MMSDPTTPAASTGISPTAKLSPGLPRAITPIGSSSGPELPYPLKIEGPVVKGFGRGSKELNIPTANIPVEGLSVGGREEIANGVYFGWAGLDLGQKGNKELAKSASGNVFPMVMSIGWNPFYKNTKRSVEVHIIHTFPTDFYGTHMKLLVLGYIRPELDYVSKEALIGDIKTDIEIALVSLERDRWHVGELGNEGRWVGEF
ncbi:riboflavin kinase [Terfezia boudieri ATCC MYA-4762]|uniref:Riboflavin kinase n=1 Tax=Terfezia boudieri ATCC MYA-4762 TaxID=1051890 RepID=A0A3N4LLR7_9PEZI|nr:riboflavin kinase [Terfezia boudieri ATCC MYA-4762]